MTRREVLDRVNRHQRDRGRPPVPMGQYSRAVRIARHHRLISEEHLLWARLGYLPEPKRVAS